MRNLRHLECICRMSASEVLVEKKNERDSAGKVELEKILHNEDKNIEHVW